MSILDQAALKSLQLPLASSQQLAALRYCQGRYGQVSQYSQDLLGGMAVKSRLEACKAMAQPVESRLLFDYQQGLDYLETLDATVPLNPNQLRQLHQQLNPQGGNWRSVMLRLERRDKPGKNLRIPAGQQTIDRSIEQLLTQLQQVLDHGFEPLVVIPLFVLQFMQIFPFLDGNCRTALLLARHLLIHHGHSVMCYIDLESEFATTERAFYRSLYQSSLGNDNPTLWLGYWWVLIKRLYHRFDRQIQHANISPGRGSKTALVKRFVNQQQQPFRFNEVCIAFPTISPDQVRMALRGLRDNNIIRVEGKGRGAWWRKVE
ncbi:MAG: Fic family protein [Pseudomonadales bacterium]